MYLIDATTAEAYLRDSGRITVRQRVAVETLAGGVSNEVLYVAFPDGDGQDFVLKQARPQLRTPDPWFCGVERIWREVDVLHACQSILDGRLEEGSAPLAARTPRVIFEDRNNYAFGMTAAARDHVVWKRQLLSGVANAEIASECGKLLAALHAGGWRDAGLAERLGDRTLFDQLRLDPYYRAVASRDPTAAAALQALIDSVWQNPVTLVHADFSPKNLLVEAGGLMMIDFETGHYGDPAFDLGFFLSHLVLKAFFHAPRGEPFLELTNAFWKSYRTCLLATIAADEYVNVAARGVQNFAGCVWARLDGKSKVEYLLESPHRDSIRQVCRTVLNESVTEWGDVLEFSRRAMS